MGGFGEALGELLDRFWVSKKKVLERFGEANPEKHFFRVVLLLESFLQNRGSKKGPFFSRLLGKKIRLVTMASSWSFAFATVLRQKALLSR